MQTTKGSDLKDFAFSDEGLGIQKMQEKRQQHVNNLLSLGPIVPNLYLPAFNRTQEQFNQLLQRVGTASLPKAPTASSQNPVSAPVAQPDPRAQALEQLRQKLQKEGQ